MSEQLKLRANLIKILRRLRLPVEVVYDVYCLDRPVPENYVDRLVQLEDELSKTTQNVEDFIKKVLCEKRAVIEIPVIVNTEVKKIVIGVSKKVEILPESEVKPCNGNIVDVIVGSVYIYFKCPDGRYESYMHRLSHGEYVNILKKLKGES